MGPDSHSCTFPLGRSVSRKAGKIKINKYILTLLNSPRWLKTVTGPTGLMSQLISTPLLPTQPMKSCTTPLVSTPPTLCEQQYGSFYVPQESEQWKSCEMGPKVFSSLSRMTEMSNHLQMSQQRRHILLNHFKTLRIGPAWIWTHDFPLSRPALSQMS